MLSRITVREDGSRVTYLAFREAYNRLIAPLSRQTFSANVAKGVKSGTQHSHFNCYGFFTCTMQSFMPPPLYKMVLALSMQIGSIPLEKLVCPSCWRI